MYASICRPNYVASSTYKILSRFLANRCITVASHSTSTIQTRWLLTKKPAALNSRLGNLVPKTRINIMSSQLLLSRHLSTKSTDDNIKTDNSETSGQDQKNTSAMQRLRVVFRDYGTIGITFHIAISLISVGCWYMAVKR